METQKERLFQTLIDIANSEYDGHFTLMKFTTNWRCCFGTVEEYDRLDNPQIEQMAKGKTMEIAIRNCILKNCSTYNFK